MRLEHRAYRLERVLAALRARARGYSPSEIPAGLRSAIHDFDRELTSARQGLAGYGMNGDREQAREVRP